MSAHSDVHLRGRGSVISICVSVAASLVPGTEDTLPITCCKVEFKEEKHLRFLFLFSSVSQELSYVELVSTGGRTCSGIYSLIPLFT